MQKDENHDAGPSALPSSQSVLDCGASHSRIQLGPKLRDKLEKLAKWRIDPSSIGFPDDAPELRGGNATVSRGLLGSLSGGQHQEKVVAVKKMNMLGDPSRVLELTLREAEFLVGLSHENVIKLEGFAEDLSKDLVLLVFPWEENGTLKEFIASADWEIPERISLINDVARGVEHLHSQQPPIRHGDLKSINILVNSECRAVITDFGSARRLKIKDLQKETRQTVENKPPAAPSLDATFRSSTKTIDITLTGDRYTLRWAAPELLREEEGTLGSDIWALGWVAYEVMTDSIPFQDVKDTVVVIRVIRGDLPSLTDDARMSLIQALCSLMLACWGIDPHERPTAEDCRKSIDWMPMIGPNPIRTAETAASRARSPALLMKLGNMYMRQGDYPNTLKFYTSALSGYGETGDSNGRAAALVQLAHVHRLQNEHSQAVIFYSMALEIFTDIGDSQGRAGALWGLASVHLIRNEYSQAITLYSEALQIFTDIEDNHGSSAALFGLAEVHRAENEYSQAIIRYSEALQILTDIGDRQGRAGALRGLAEVHRARDEYIQAVTFYSEALQIFTDIGDRQGRAGALWGLADVYRFRNEHNQAVTFYSEALQISTDIDDWRGRADALWGLAEVHLVRRDYSQAGTLYSEVLEICTSLDDEKGRADALRGLAEVHRVEKEDRQAITLDSKVLDIHVDGKSRAGALGGRAEFRRSLAEFHRVEKEDKAMALYSRVQDIHFDGERRADDLLSRADVCRDQGRYSDAIGYYMDAAKLFECLDRIQDAAGAFKRASELRRL